MDEVHAPALVSIPTRSARAALDAAWEMEALLELLLRDHGPGSVYASEEAAREALKTRGIAMRMRSLTSVVMSTLGNDSDDPVPLEEMVYGHTPDSAAEGIHA